MRPASLSFCKDAARLFVRELGCLVGSVKSALAVGCRGNRVVLYEVVELLPGTGSAILRFLKLGQLYCSFFRFHGVGF